MAIILDADVIIQMETEGAGPTFCRFESLLATPQYQDQVSTSVPIVVGCQTAQPIQSFVPLRSGHLSKYAFVAMLWRNVASRAFF